MRPISEPRFTTTNFVFSRENSGHFLLRAFQIGRMNSLRPAGNAPKLAGALAFSFHRPFVSVVALHHSLRRLIPSLIPEAAQFHWRVEGLLDGLRSPCTGSSEKGACATHGAVTARKKRVELTLELVSMY